MAFASSLRSALKVPVRAALTSASSPAPRFCQPAFLGSFRTFSAKFTKTHEWLVSDGDNHVMGISGFAANALGEVVYATCHQRVQHLMPKTPSALWRVSRL